MRSIITDYSFDHLAGNVFLTGLTVEAEKVLLIVNVTRGVIMFAPGDYARGIVGVGFSTIALRHDTTGYDDTDELQIFYETADPDPLTDTQLRAADVPVSGDFYPATQPVSGTFWQATQPVSGPVTDAQLRATAVPVSGTFWQATQPVSGPLTDTQLRASALPVSGAFYQATQPVSAASLPLPTGAATAANQSTAIAALGATTDAAAGDATGSINAHLRQIAKYADQPIAAGSAVIGGVTIADGSSVSIGAKADSAASSDTGTFSLIALFKRLLQGITTLGTNTTGLATAAAQTSANTKLDTLHTDLVAATPAGANVIGGITVADGSDVSIGAKADAAATTDTGTFSLIALNKRQLQSLTTLGTNTTDGVSVTPASLTATGNLFSIDTAGYQAISVQVTSAGSSCTITYEVSNDNSTWQSCLTYIATSNNAGIATSTAAALVYANLYGRYFRARVSTYGSGTVTCTYALRKSAFPIQNMAVTGNGGTGVGVQATQVPSATVGGFTSTHTLISAATTNATSVKASAGTIGGITVQNIGLVKAYFKLYNKASAPTVGTDVPVLVLALFPSDGVNISYPQGLRLSTGIAYALTTGIANADTGAVPANEIPVNIAYI